MKNVFKHSAIFLLFYLCMIVVVTTLLYFVHISISCYYLPIIGLISGISYYFISKKELLLKDYFKVLLIALIVMIISMVVTSFTFDRSSDGNTYHKDAVGVLKEGFNPVYSESKNFIIKRDSDDKLTNYSIWTDHYAKANWIMGANFYSITGNIESGKAMNFISIYIVFVIIFIGLASLLSWQKSLAISLITVINPITASQMFTYYNDQLVCLYLFLAIFMLFKLTKNIKDKEAWFIYILSFVLLTNTKFNGLGYIMIFSFIFVLKYLYNSYKDKCFMPIFKQLCLIFIPLFIFSFVIVGYPTYVKNTIDHQNPFFPLYDDNGEDIITAQEPKKFVKMNNISKLFYGTFSRANNLRDNDKTDIKIPFSVYKSEVKPAMSNDLRISGWGIWFSGILIISLIILIVYFKNYKTEDYIFIALSTTLLLLVIMSESWWARYSPYFYLFIILSLYILLNHCKSKTIKTVYVLLICINTLIPLLGNSYYTLTNSFKIRKDLNNLKNKTIVIKNDNPYNGIFYNLKDFDIDYTFGNIEGEKLYYNYLDYEIKK